MRIGCSHRGYLTSSPVASADGSFNHFPFTMKEILRRGHELIWLNEQRVVQGVEGPWPYNPEFAAITETFDLNVDIRHAYRHELPNFPRKKGETKTDWFVRYLIQEFRDNNYVRDNLPDVDVAVFRMYSVGMLAYHTALCVGEYARRGTPVVLEDGDHHFLSSRTAFKKTLGWADENFDYILFASPALYSENFRQVCLTYPYQPTREQPISELKDKTLDLAYVGNDYWRTDRMLKYYANASLSAKVGGNWQKNIEACNRLGDRLCGYVPNAGIGEFYREAQASVQILGDDHVNKLHFTQRVNEVTQAGVLILHDKCKGAAAWVANPERQVVSSAEEVEHRLHSAFTSSDQAKYTQAIVDQRVHISKYLHTNEDWVDLFEAHAAGEVKGKALNAAGLTYWKDKFPVEFLRERIGGDPPISISLRRQKR